MLLRRDLQEADVRDVGFLADELGVEGEHARGTDMLDKGIDTILVGDKDRLSAWNRGMIRDRRWCLVGTGVRGLVMAVSPAATGAILGHGGYRLPGRRSSRKEQWERGRAEARPRMMQSHDPGLGFRSPCRPWREPCPSFPSTR